MARFTPPPPSRLKGNALATLVRIFVLAAFLVAAVQVPAFAGRQDFTFVNFSGRTIYEIYVSPSDVNDWEENVLKKALKHGSHINIRFPDNDTRRFWDIKAVFQDGKYWRWDGIDLQTVSKVTVDGAGTITKT